MAEFNKCRQLARWAHLMDYVLTSIRLCPSVDKIILAVIVVETNILSL
jgi:hypothetical protein